MLANWGVIESDWDRLYGRDLTDDVFRRRKSWRWVHTRLLGLLGGDTTTGRLYQADHHPDAHSGHQAIRKPLTPTGVGDLLESWAN